jgi:hypothetical protein
MLSYLFSQKYERSELDFKEIIETTRGSNFAKDARHFFAMSNYGGGYLLVGFRSKPKGGYEPIGLPTDFHIDQAELQGKFNSFASTQLTIGYIELERTVGESLRKFAVVYIPPAPEVLTPIKDGEYENQRGKKKKSFRRGEVLVRRGTSSVDANQYELEWIKARAKDTSYRSSLISGQPDRVEERLTTNLFRFLQVPKLVYECTLDLRGNPILDHGLNSCLFRGNQLYSFSDPSKSSLSRYIRHDTLRSDTIVPPETDPDQARLVVELLESAVVLHAWKIGMLFDERRHRLYYPLERGTRERVEDWPGLTRPSPRVVASMEALSALGREAGVHQAAGISFVRLGGDSFLQIVPGYVLTDDGLTLLGGSKQGRVLTSLESWTSSFNAGYLRNVVFWAHKLFTGATTLSLGSSLEIDGKALQVSIGAGIRGDNISSAEAHERAEVNITADGGSYD